MWNKYNHDFGDQPEGQHLATIFEYSGSKIIRKIVPNCDCTTHRFNGITLAVIWKLAVKYRERDSKTYLTVEYTDGSIDDLNLECHVIINT